jgi:DNA-binding sugar fermentation-stimulating protein
MIPLHSLPPLVRVRVLHRPSKIIKSPYVADVVLDSGEEALCHTPGLGCSGLVAPGRILYVSRATNNSAKTDYTAQVAECEDSEGAYYVGIHPMVSQAMAGHLLDHVHPDVVWRSEVKVDTHTRMDFVGTVASGKKVYVEVKNAMISHQTHVERSSRRAVFPEGYRKVKTDTFSPRALKHAELLGDLVGREDTEAAYLVYIVPRHDCQDGLELHSHDPVYRQGVAEAMASGVQVRVFGLHVDADQISFDRPLPFHAP